MSGPDVAKDHSASRTIAWDECWEDHVVVVTRCAEPNKKAIPYQVFSYRFLQVLSLYVFCSPSETEYAR